MLNYAAGNPVTGYNLTRSLRFRASASAYLSRNSVASPTNNSKWTWSGWVKRGTLGGASNVLMGGYLDDNNFGSISFASDTLTMGRLVGGTYQNIRQTNAVYRDPSAWYHIVFVFDLANATVANRANIYVNGVLQTYSTSNDPDPYGMFINAPSYAQTIARTNYTGGAQYFDGYIAEQYFIDGQALTPSSFGSYNSTTGVWQPAKYTGTYGTNGFYLPFTDNSALTTSSNVGLGKDFSGNGNYWTTNNISLTAGVTYDSMTDVPTLTSATAANFATWNPLQAHDSGITVTHADGNLSVSSTYSSGANMTTVPSTMKTPSSGKWYWEITAVTNTSGSQSGFGVITADSFVEGGAPPTNNYLYIGTTGNKLNNGTSVAYGATYGVGDVIGVALDVGAGTLEFYKNGTSQGVAYTGLAAVSYFAAATNNGTGTRTYACNFGQRPFSYTPPSGFVALNAYNLPDSTIKQGNKVMDATLWTGNASARSITNAAGFKPDLVWGKSRSATYSNWLYDSIRGTGVFLSSNLTNADVPETNLLTAFNSNGFSLGTSTSGNDNTQTFVAWQWQAGQGSSSSNTNGTITSTVSVNASAGFSVVTYTGTGGAPRSVGHGLGVAPSFIIVKQRNAVDNWVCYHSALGATQYIYLNVTNAAGTAGTMWDNTAPTSSVFTLGSNAATNGNGTTMVAYCWSEIAGFSKFGIYTGNGSADGPFVYLGFRPKYVLIRRYQSSGYWLMYDSIRDTYNVVGKELYANTADVEGNSPSLDFLSNGFKIRTNDPNRNVSGENLLYAAFAENPFKNALAR